MAITVNNEIIKIAGLELQNSNLWELYEEKQTEIKYRVKSISLPFLSLETLTRKTGTKHYSDFVPEDDFDITLYETVDFSTFNYLKAWKDEAYDPEKKVFNTGANVGIRNFIIAFQFDFVYNIYGPVAFGERKYNKSFKFERVKIKKISNFDLTYEGAEPLIITATCIADRVIEIPVSTLTNNNSFSPPLIPHY